MAKSRNALRFATPGDMPVGMARLYAEQEATENARHARMVENLRNPAAAAPVAKKPRHARHAPGVMNKTEAAYDQQLALRKHAGEITWYAFEKIKLRLAKATFLTVDFFVLLADGGIECHEVKGRTAGDKFWAEEDARIKLKVAAEMFPFRFVVVWPKKGGGWHRQVVGRG